MQIIIEQAGANDIETVSEILQESALWLIEKGEKLWDLDSLTVNKISDQVESGMFWVAKVDGEGAGCVRFQLKKNIGAMFRTRIRRLFIGLPSEENSPGREFRGF